MTSDSFVSLNLGPAPASDTEPPDAVVRHYGVVLAIVPRSLRARKWLAERTRRPESPDPTGVLYAAAEEARGLIAAMRTSGLRIEMPSGLAVLPGLPQALAPGRTARAVSPTRPGPTRSAQVTNVTAPVGRWASPGESWPQFAMAVFYTLLLSFGAVQAFLNGNVRNLAVTGSFAVTFGAMAALFVLRDPPPALVRAVFVAIGVAITLMIGVGIGSVSAAVEP